MDFDRAVIAALFADEHVRLRSHLVRRGVPAPAAADAVQDAFLRLMRAPINEICDLRAYLRRIAETVVIDAARRRSRAAKVIDPFASCDESVPDPAPLADAAMITAEEFAALRAAVRELPPRSRTVLVLHKFDGLSYAEVAARLGISRNTVMAHMFAALKRLRLCLVEPERTVSAESGRRTA